MHKLIISIFKHAQKAKNAEKAQDPATMKKEKINIGKHMFDVEVASTNKERALGLMYRKDLRTADGMLFIMKNEPVFFHMMNTEIPLDVLFFNDEGQVIKIDQMEPHSGKSKCLMPTSYVVELPMGTCKNLGIDLGDSIGVEENKQSLHAESLLRTLIKEVLR